MKPALDRRFASGAALAALFASAVSHAAPDEGTSRPAVVPYRPTVSSPADLSAPGWIEAEMGAVFARDTHPDANLARRAGLPYALKLAFAENVGLRVAGEAAVRGSEANGAIFGGGDTALIGKARLPVADAIAFGLELGADFATARHRLGTGSGRTDPLATVVFSSDLPHALHVDVNWTSTRFGTIDPGTGRLQTSGALALSERVDDRWTLDAEWSGMHRRHVAGTAQALVAASYALRRDIVVDFGVAHALNRATPTWQSFAGVTFIVGRAF